MTAQILDGEAVAKSIRDRVGSTVAELKAKNKGVGLGTILVGDDSASARYVEMEHKDCGEVGIGSVHGNLPSTATTEDVLAKVNEFNANPEVDAYIVQLPLPKGIDEQKVLAAIDPAKDADGLHPFNLGLLVMGRPGPIACTPAGILELLSYYGVDPSGKHVAIVGRGLTIGRPLALLLSLKRPGCNAAVSVVHTGVKNSDAITRTADIVIAAAGSPGVITADSLKPGAVVVGAGTSWEGRRLISDLDDSVYEVASWATPRLGGVGPMTRAMLLANTLEAAKLALQS